MKKIFTHITHTRMALLVFLLIAAVFAFPYLAQAAMSVVQTDDHNVGGGVANVTPTFASGATAGNRIVVCIANGSGNSYTPPAGFTEELVIATSTDNSTTVLYTKIATGGETSMTFTRSGTSGAFRAFAYEITPAGVLDVFAHPASEGGFVLQQHTGSTTATSYADSIAIGCMGVAGGNITSGQAVDNGFTLDYSGGFMFVSHKIFTSTQSEVGYTNYWTGATKVPYAGIVVYGEEVSDPSVPAVGTNLVKTIIRALTVIKGGTVFK